MRSAHSLSGSPKASSFFGRFRPHRGRRRSAAMIRNFSVCPSKTCRFRCGDLPLIDELQAMSRLLHYRGDSGPPPVRRLRYPGNRAGPPGRGYIIHRTDRYPAEIVKGIYYIIISTTYETLIPASPSFCAYSRHEMPVAQGFQDPLVCIEPQKSSSLPVVAESRVRQQR